MLPTTALKIKPPPAELWGIWSEDANDWYRFDDQFHGILCFDTEEMARDFVDELENSNYTHVRFK